MLNEILFLLLGTTVKESLGSITINLLSDFLSVKISDKKMRKAVCRFRKELYLWVVQFQKKNDGTIVTTGAFLNYLENYRVIDRIYEYAFSTETELLKEDEFLQDLKTRSVAYVREQNGLVNATDGAILEEFYDQLLRKVQKFIRSTSGLKYQEVLYQINQIRLGNKLIYEELLHNSLLTKSALERIEQIYQEMQELLIKNGPDLNEEWFVKQNRETIMNMGDRYMPELNVELPIQTDIEIMAADSDVFQQISEKYNNILINMNKVGRYNEIMHCFAEQLSEILRTSCTFELFNKNRKSLEMLISLVYSCAGKHIKQITKENSSTMQEYDRQLSLRLYMQIRQGIDELQGFLSKERVQLLQHPFLLIHGKGGVGKSHLIAATVEDRRKKGKRSILLLGQDFPEDCIIWQRVRDLIKTEPDEEKFLERLNELAREKHGRILLFIDAINEGGGRKLWKDRLEGVVKKIAKYPYLGLVFSIRDEFMREMTPQSLLDRCHITKLAHTGFGAYTNQLVEVYFAYYDIDKSALSYFPREFSNGLFLRLFCEGHKGKSKNDIKINTGAIYRNYLKSMDEKLADRYQYSKEIDFVDALLKQFVEKSYGKNTRNKLEKEYAKKMVVSLAGEYQIPTRIYDDLLAEGVLALSEEKSEEYVYITYERLADHIFVKSKIKEVLEKSRSDEELLEELNQPGILEELACMLPEYNLELFERFPQLADETMAVQAEIDSIAWRTEGELDENKILDYVNEHIVPDPLLWEKFYESLIWISINEKHVFNAQFLHDNLISDCMADRDACYIPLFLEWRGNQSPVQYLLDWIDMVDQRQVSVTEKQVYLCALILSWMLIVTDIKYRDQISAALCCLLRGHIYVMKQVLEQFEQVDDMYILERLYAVAYGVVTFEKNTKAVKELAEYVYETIFNKAVIVPDILVRDAAKGIVLYANSVCSNSAIDIQKVVGPYHSNFPEIPDKETIERYEENSKEKGWREGVWAQNKILSSMQIDDRNHYYGDFGRYVFQNFFRDWKELPADALMRVAIQDIFRRGYDVKKHGRFDWQTGRYAELQTNKVERIGKKYQWQALYQLAAQVSDQFQRKNEATGEMEYNTGAYEPNLRDFDPTVNDKNFVGSYGAIKPILIENYEMDHQDWLKITDDYPGFEESMIMVVGEDTYVGLSGYWDWDEPIPAGFEKYDCPMKNMWFMSQAYIVRDEDFECCKKYLENANFWGRWMPEPTDNYSIYNREYYWSDVQKYYENEYYGGNEWQQIWQADIPQISDVSFLVPIYSYVATGEKEFQNISYNRWKKPCKTLYQKCKLSYGSENTVMYDQGGKMICFDSVEIFGEDRGFFFHKATLEKFLADNHYRIFWQVLGEKRIIGGSYHDEKNNGYMEYTGFYCMEDGKFCGNIRLEKTGGREILK